MADRAARLTGGVLAVAMAGAAYALDAVGEDTASAFILGCVAGALASLLIRFAFGGGGHG